MPKITPKTADMLNERIEAHFKSYPKEKEVAVTPDGQLFHCDEKTNHAKKVCTMQETMPKSAASAM